MMNNSVTQQRMPTKCQSGLLALKVPDPPQFAPSAVCAISSDGKIAAVGGRDIELFLWDVDTGDLLSKIRGHDIFWVGSHDNTFFITCQEDGKVHTCCSAGIGAAWMHIDAARSGKSPYDLIQQK